jgi:hypothetical protein
VRKFLWLGFSLICLLSAITLTFAGGFERSPFEPPPAPEIVLPRSEEVDLTGKDNFECKWISLKPAEVDHFELKLYKGYDMYESGLIFSENVSSGKTSFLIKASTFELGQVYTLSLCQVSYGGEKSDRVFTSFKIIAK